MQRFHVGLLLTALAFTILYLIALPDARACLLEASGGIPRATDVFNHGLQCANLSLFIAAGMGITGLLILLAERKSIADLVANHPLATAMSITAVAALPYLSRGNVALGDAALFAALTAYMQSALYSATLPYWTGLWYMGNTPFVFYGWLHPFVSGLLSGIVGLDWSNKILFYCLHLGSVYLMYRFLALATNTRAAMIGAVIYGLSFQHFAPILIGRSLASIMYFLTPALFLVWEKLIQREMRAQRAIALLAITASLLIFNHQLDGLFLTAAFGGYALLQAYETRTLRLRAIQLGMSGIVTLLLTAFWIAPMLLQRHLASTDTKLALIIMPHVPHVSTILDAFLWPGLWGQKELYYLGISAILLSIAGSVLLIRTKKYIPVSLGAILLLMLIQSTRYAPALLILMALASSYALAHHKVRLSRMGYLVLLAILLIDFIPATTQVGYPEFGYHRAFYSSIDAQPGERIIDVTTNRNTFWNGLTTTAASTDAVFGSAIETAPSSFIYSAAIANSIAQEVYDQNSTLSNTSLDGLYLLGVKHLVTHPTLVGKDPYETFVAKEATLGLERNLSYYELEEHSLLIAAPQLVTVQELDLASIDPWNARRLFETRDIPWRETDVIIEMMNINRSARTAARILVKDAAANALHTQPHLTIEAVDAQVDQYTITYTLTEPSYVQAAFSHDPRLSMQLNNEAVTYYKTAIDTIAFESPAGTHTLTITAQPPRITWLLTSVHILGLITTVALLRNIFKESRVRQAHARR